MPTIELQTRINANKSIVFDLSRSIDLHKISTAHTNEEAVAGRTTGLIELDETVTWRARHFGIYQHLTSKMTELDRPNFFADEMVSGIFRAFRHEHQFEDLPNGTLMTDVFCYQSPFGLFGRLADRVIVEKYMTGLLKTRNSIIKEIAESGKWKALLVK